MLISEKIEKIRSYFASYHIDGFIIPSNDEFRSEYVPEHNNRLKFVTGFSGSSGVALITLDDLVFFTDGRYLKQAEKEIGQDFTIKNICELYDNSYLKNNKIGYDPKLHTPKNISLYKSCQLISCDNLVDIIWLDRPIAKLSKIFNYPIKYAGESSSSKRQKLRNYLHDNQLYAIIISDPSNVCWLLNIRANDVEFNPILLSQLIFYYDGRIELFYGDNQITSDHLNKLSSKKIQLDVDTASVWLVNHFIDPVVAEDPCVMAKACKNKIEIKHAKKINIIDSLALCRFLYWIEHSKELITELDIANKLIEFRKLDPAFLYPSFATIAGFAENAAVIHYHANEKSNKTIDGDSLLLVDSGGQYFGGTTDITRVIPFGKITYEQKYNFTLVLKGHIAIANAKFPIGTTGAELDVLARYYLWQHGKNYAHGTGHGVGNCLSVHEGPQRISKFASHALCEGMILSNEPGYYKNDEYGIRIENLMLVKKDKKNQGYLCFETMSLVPIDKKLIIFDLLSYDEKKWLNLYHKKIYKTISPDLSAKEKIWLMKKTSI